ETLGTIRLRLKQLPAGVGVHPDVTDGIINDRYQEILRKKRWARLMVDDESIVTTPVYQDGTIAVTEGSTAIVGTSTVWTAAMDGQRIRIGGRTEYYIFTFVDATHGTLDRGFEGDTESDVSYWIWVANYALNPDVVSLESVRVPIVNRLLTKRDRTYLD